MPAMGGGYGMSMGGGMSAMGAMGGMGQQSMQQPMGMGGMGMGGMGGMGMGGMGMGGVAISSAPAAIRAFDKDGLQVMMEASKPEPANPSVTRVLCRFHNLNAAPLEGLVFQVRAAAVSLKSCFRLPPPGCSCTILFASLTLLLTLSLPRHRCALRLTPSQAAVPKYLKLEMQPPSSTTIPPSSAGQVTQVRLASRLLPPCSTI